MARRAGYKTLWNRTYPGSPLLLLDTGNISDLPTPEGEAKTKSLVDFMGKLGYRTSGVGEQDLARGWDWITELGKIGKFPFVSGNVVYQRSGEPVFERFVLLPVNSKEFPAYKGKPFTVGVTAFVRFNPTFLKAAASDNMILANPLDEAKKFLPELRKKCDFLVILAEMPKDDVHLLARGVKGIDLILAAYGGLIAGAEEKEGDTRIVFLGNQGKYLAEIRAMRVEARWETTQTLHYLGTTYPEDPKAAALIAQIMKEINDANRMFAEARPTAPSLAAPAASAGGGALVQGSAAAAAAGRPKLFLGSERCGECHAKEYETWKETKHAHAFDILVEQKAEFNPECVKCHVTGFQARGGFVDAKATPELENVHCESCHGPGASHPDSPAAPYGRTGGEASCKSCHTGSRSPHFKFDSYWPKIQH